MASYPGWDAIILAFNGAKAHTCPRHPPTCRTRRASCLACWTRHNRATLPTLGKDRGVLWEYGSSNLFLIRRPTHMACHNKCLNNKVPAGIEHLLGLGAIYCVKHTKLPTNTIGTTTKQTRRNINRKYIFQTHLDETIILPGCTEIVRENQGW